MVDSYHPLLSAWDSTLATIFMDRFMIVCPLSAIAISALIAPRLQLFTNLVCKELDSRQWDPAGATTPHRVGFVSTTRPVPCAADPVVQANVTKLLTGACYSALVQFSCSSYAASLVMATVQGVLSCLTAAFWGSVRFQRSLLRIWLNHHSSRTGTAGCNCSGSMSFLYF